MINSKNHNPDPAYLKALIHSAGLTQSDVCTALGIPKRTWSDWMSKEHPSRHSYCVQVAVEALVRERLELGTSNINPEQYQQQPCDGCEEGVRKL